MPANTGGEQLRVGDGLIEGGALKVLYGRYQRTGTGDGTHPHAHGEIRIADAVADVLSARFGIGPACELSFNGVPVGR